jgi:HEXXH motif-containing protein
MREYVLSDEQFRSLARGAGRPGALDLLVESQVSKRRLLLLDAIDKLPPGHDDLLAALVRLDREAPSAMGRMLRHPFLEAWFADFARQPDGPALPRRRGTATGSRTPSCRCHREPAVPVGQPSCNA